MKINVFTLFCRLWLVMLVKKPSLYMVGLLLLGTLTQAQTTLLTLKSCQQTGTSYTWTNNTGSAVTLRITAQGGGGGKGHYMIFESIITMGSTGATVKGDFVVQPGHILMFVAGGKGENAKTSQSDFSRGGGGGGAGSGVVNLSTNTVLMIAAGGTGATGVSANEIGLGGSGATDGNGSGGDSGFGLSTGGGGLNGNGGVGGFNNCTRGGGQVSLIGISVGGARCSNYPYAGRGGSGMGGGGGASDLAGGGGGHTGGNGGDRYYGPYSRAKSYNSGTNPVNTNGSDGVEPNDGQVLVEVLSGNPAPITQAGSVLSATHPIVSISHPSSCKGMDGSISLTGLVINTTYSVTYKKDNDATTTVEVTSNNNGVITLSNLGAGNYTQIVATEGGCASNAVSASLADPVRPSITLGNISTICEGAMSFSIPYTNPTQSPQKYSIEGLDITPVTDGSLSNPITVNLSNAASGTSIPFTLTVKNTITNCESSNIMGMVVVQKNAGGTVSSAQTICSGTSPLDLSLSGQTQTGSVVKWQKSSDANFGNSVDIASTATTLPSATIGTLTADTYFRAVVQNGMCSASSSSVKITVNPVSVGGTVSSAQTICSGTSPLSLSLSGQTGSVVKWQKASDANFSTPVDIASTETTLPSGTIGSLTADTYFRAVVKSGVCSEAISSTVKITINSVSVGGTVSSAQTICSGTSPLDISLSGQTGSVVKWQKSSDANFSNAVDIASTAMLTTLPSATIGALTTDTYFRAVVKSGVCSEAISSSVKITINSVSVGGVVSSAQTICSGTAPADLSLSGQVGNVVRWEKSTNSSFSSRSIISSTSTTLTSAIIGSLTTDTYFRAIVKSGECAEATSSIVLIRVNSLPTATIAGTTVVCQNSPRPQLTFTGSNGTAPYTFTYILKGTEKAVTTESGNSVSVEAPTNEVGTFEYSLVSVKDGSSTACSQTQTGSATVTVNPLPTAMITGTTAVCQNSTMPKITFTGSNGTAPYTFTYSLKGTEKMITTENGNSVSIDAPTNEVGTFEYSLVSVKDASTTTCSQAQSGSATVTVNPLPTAMITGTTAVCQNSARPQITFTGTNGTAPYTFTYSLKGTEKTVTTESGNSVSVEVPTNEAGTFEYSLVSVKDASTTVCSQVQTGSVTVTVNPLPTATIAGTTAVCQNTARPQITFTGANGTAPYTFTYSLKGTEKTVTTESGNSVSVEVPTNEIGTFEYSLVSVKDASTTVCSQAQTGSVTVTVNPLPTAMITGTTAVCQNSTMPKITFTGSNGTAPYTFTYSLKGTEKTVTTESGNSVSVEVPTNEAGTFEYSLVSVKDASTTVCSQAQTGSATVTVNPLPTAMITGTTAVCQNSARPKITFTGANGTAPYTFTYSLKGTEKTVTTENGNSVSIDAPTNEVGTFEYSLVSVKDASTTVCSQVQSGSATVTVNPLPTASISGATSVCQNGTSPTVTFVGANGTAPYTFTYKINDGAPQTVKTATGNSVTVSVPTSVTGVFTYTLLSVSESSSTSCSQLQSGSVEIKVQGKPTITLSTLQQTLNEGNNQTFCDTDANPVNSLQFTVSGLCVSGNPVWRVQVGSGAWSSWAPNPPVSQSSNNQVHRYQAACDANCTVTYTSPITVQINYRASTPQQVSLVADGVTVNEGETKEVCNIEGNALIFNVTCASGEIAFYSVDGGDYGIVAPTQLVDGQFHNYRVRCRKIDGTLSCIETESGVMRIRLNSVGQTPVASLNVTSGCGTPVSFSGTASCGSLTTVWYNASTNEALATLPSQTPTETMSYYARCQAGGGCLSEKSNMVTFTVIPVSVAPVVSVSSEIVCAGTSVKISANCPLGSQTLWSTGVTTPSFEVAFNNVTKQTYWAKCVFSGGCQSTESLKKDVYWNAFVVTLINIGESKSSVKTNDRTAWSSQFITRDGGPELEQSTQVNPTLYYVENANKVAPRYWTINVEACGLGTDGSLTFDMLATPEMGVIRSFNTHENNAPYFMYANRDGWTELYAQNHPAYGFYQDNGAGGNVYDLGLPKGLYKLGIRYWDMKGWGSIYPSTRKPQGNVLAYQEYWFRIQSKDGVGVGAARVSGLPFTVEGSRSSVEVMPNPVSTVLRLQVQGSKGQEVNATLTDASGRSVLRRDFVPEANTHQEEFEVSELPTGMYFLQVVTAEKQAVLKVVKVD